MSEHQTEERILTGEFVAINAIIFLTFCNIALFFSFHSYLGTLAIDPSWQGFVIGVFSLVGLIIRPIISPFLGPGNARRWVAIGGVMTIVSLILYHWATDLWTMSLVRILHGVAYIVMGTASISVLVGVIPKNRSGQAFGLVGVLTLIPYAVIPPLVEPLMKWLGSFDRVLILSAIAMVPTFPLLAVMKVHEPGSSSQQEGPIGLQELMDNLRNRQIVWLLVVSLAVWTAFAPVFYFVKEYGQKIGVINPGLFFTFSMIAEIGVRLAAGRLLDKANKVKLLAASLGWLAAGYLAMIWIPGEVSFYGVGLFLGLGWGVCMPLLSGLMFDISEPRFRALNTNLSYEMFQGGFVLGPVLGCAFMMHWGYGALFCGGAAILAFGLIAVLRIKDE